MDEFTPSVSGMIRGKGLGRIDPLCLTKERWPLHTSESIVQYRKFVRLMINRIRIGESNDEETANFLQMSSGREDWTYLAPALGMLPELEDDPPLPTNPQMSELVEHVRNTIKTKEAERLRQVAGEQPSQETSPQGPQSFAGEIREKFAKLLFGPHGEMNATPAMKRMLDSWLELGYPLEALQRFKDKEDRIGRDLSRDSLGLPSLMRQSQKKLRVVPKPAPVPVNVTNNRNYWGPMKKAPRQKHAPGSSRNPLPPKQAPRRAVVPPKAVDETDPGYDDVELEEGSPEPVPLPDDERPGSVGLSSKSSRSVRSSTTGSRATSPDTPTFWNFERTHRTDYENCLYPMTEEELEKTRVHQETEIILPEITDEGTTLVRGFERPPPEESRTMLKEANERAIENNIRAASQDQSRDEYAHFVSCGYCAYCLERKKGKMPEIDEDSSDDDTIRYTRPVYESTVSPDSSPPASLTGTSPFPSLDSADQKRFDEFMKRINERPPLKISVPDSDSDPDSLPPLAGSSWRPLEPSDYAKEA
ncbi:MAG: hypothetical protein Q9220_004819 [cf. Caloplaca sp. 1 TL-2023]